MRETDEYYFFWRHQFGQWTLRNMTAPDRITYNCCEQYMMYHKAMLCGDRVTAEKILSEPEPALQKDLGREVQHFDSALWDQHKLGVVWYGNFLKFSQHRDLRERLVATGNKILAEASPVDLVWGVGFKDSDDRILDPSNWTGKNLLGKVLMSIRTLMKDDSLGKVQPGSPT